MPTQEEIDRACTESVVQAKQLRAKLGLTPDEERAADVVQILLMDTINFASVEIKTATGLTHEQWRNASRAAVAVVLQAMMSVEALSPGGLPNG
jgi:hypothetical protein